MKDETKKKFHITLTDNETGETLIDSDTSAIIGAFDLGEGNTGSLYALACNGLIKVCTIAGAMATLERVRKDDPFGYILADTAQHTHDTEKQEEHHD